MIDFRHEQIANCRDKEDWYADEYKNKN